MGHPAALCVFLVALAAVNTRAQDAERIVPVHQEPRHRMVFEAGSTRILHLQVQPGDTSLFHTHAEPIVYVVIQTTETQTQNIGSEWSAARNQLPFTAPPSGVFGTTSYVENPVTHRIRNAGKDVFELIAILNLSPGEETQTPETAGFTGKPEHSNRWFRAYRISVPAGASVRHEHATPTVLVQTTAGTALGTGARLFGFNQPNDWGYFDPREPHQVRNAGKTAVEFIEVEVRQPPGSIRRE